MLLCNQAIDGKWEAWHQFIEAKELWLMLCYCFSSMFVASTTVPLRNKWTIGHILFVSAFEDWRIQILSKPVCVCVQLLLLMLSPLAHCLLFPWRHRITMSMNDLESLFASRTSWMTTNDWEKFQAISSLAVNKLSEALQSDDHVRDNPGGQVACFCAELKLFSVARLSRILLTNWPWTSQRVWTWTTLKTFRTKWSTSSERQSSHGTLGRTCIGHSMFLWTVTPKKCLASHICISGKWVWRSSHLISSQQYMRITSERPLELTTKSLEVAHRNMSRWYCSDARGICWLMRWLPRVTVFWTYDRDLSMFAWVCCRTSFVMWN